MHAHVLLNRVNELGKRDKGEYSINRLFAYCKGGNFNIHIWAWFDIISSAKQDKSGFIII